MVNKLLTMMFAVVKYVAAPPRRLPYATGINNLLGLMRVRRAASMAIGSTNAPAARLFMKREKKAVMPANRAIKRF